MKILLENIGIIAITFCFIYTLITNHRRDKRRERFEKRMDEMASKALRRNII